MITHSKYSSLIRLMCMLLFCTMLNACKYDDLSVAKPNENFRLAADFVKNNYDFSLFYAALQYTDLAGKLNEPGPFTVIAPNNKAFNDLGIHSPGDISKLNRDSLRQAMAYHIINRKLLQANLPVNGVDVRYETLAGISLYASFATFSPGNSAYPANLVYFSGSNAYRKDVALTNGVLHAVDKVMKQYPDKKVQSWLSARTEYSIFVSALKKFGFWDELAGSGPFTVYAPTNQALTNAGLSQAVIDQLNTADYIGARLFGVYIIPNQSFFLSDSAVFSIINAQFSYEATLRGDDSKLSIFASRLALMSVKGSFDWYYEVPDYQEYAAQTDNLCDNGIVHGINGVLMDLKHAKKK